MWSDRYYYLNIYYDKNLSVALDTNEIKALLRSMPELEQKSNFEFSNSSILPYVSISLLNAENLKSWSDKDRNDISTNLLAIVCAKDNAANFDKLKETFVKIASFLNWQLVDELTDEEVEDYVLWAPKRMY